MAFDTSITDWAKGEGISRQAGHQAIARCEIPVQEGKVDRLIATTLYRARTRIRSNTRQGTGAVSATEASAAGANAPATMPAPGAADHDLRRKKAEADIAELAALRKAEMLMEVEPATRAVFEAFRVLRDSTAAANRTAATMVLGLTDVREIEAVLDEAHRGAYTDFEARMKQRMLELAKP